MDDKDLVLKETKGSSSSLLIDFDGKSKELKIAYI